MGLETETLPFNFEDVTLEPNLRAFKGWQKDISDVHTRQDLPPAALQFIQYLESELKIPVKFISTGPEREALLVDEEVVV